MKSDAFDITASDATDFAIDSPIHGAIDGGGAPDRRRLARRQRLQDAIDSLKQMRETRAFGESELGHMPPAA